ncbi:MAG: GGDEF domain-containing protein [Gemmatimonadota bacterium]
MAPLSQMEVETAPPTSAKSDDLFATIYEQTQRVLGPTCGFYVITYEADRDLARLAYFVDRGIVTTPDVVFSASQCDAIRDRRVLINDSFARVVCDDVVSSISAPMIRGEVVLGAFGAFARETRFYDARDANAIEAIAQLCALILENARLHEQLHALSLTDPLTEMPNRRHMAIFLEKEFAAARRGRKLSVLLFDLDHFKEYNDREGHQAGDAVLRAFARVMIGQTRAMNLAVRYGGDEFITILADTDRRGALTHADRIIREIARDPLLRIAGVQASVGVAAYEAGMNSFEDLIRAADRDLYARKGARKKIGV